ncbi:unnamed protein product, partial [Closterium sp. Yama58-4]
RDASTPRPFSTPPRSPPSGAVYHDGRPGTPSAGSHVLSEVTATSGKPVHLGPLASASPPRPT